MRPFRGGAVTHNGAPLYREAVLKPGDLLGLGGHFLFLYRDPRVTPAPPLALPLPWQADSSASCSPAAMVDRQEALRQYLGSAEALLRFQPRHADTLLQVSEQQRRQMNIVIGRILLSVNTGTDKPSKQATLCYLTTKRLQRPLRCLLIPGNYGNKCRIQRALPKAGIASRLPLIKG